MKLTWRSSLIAGYYERTLLCVFVFDTYGTFAHELDRFHLVLWWITTMFRNATIKCKDGSVCIEGKWNVPRFEIDIPVQQAREALALGAVYQRPTCSSIFLSVLAKVHEAQCNFSLGPKIEIISPYAIADVIEHCSREEALFALSLYNGGRVPLSLSTLRRLAEDAEMLWAIHSVSVDCDSSQLDFLPDDCLDGVECYGKVEPLLRIARSWIHVRGCDLDQPSFKHKQDLHVENDYGEIKIFRPVC